jgi:hypothetical protein
MFQQVRTYVTNKMMFQIEFPQEFVVTKQNPVPGGITGLLCSWGI